MVFTALAILTTLVARLLPNGSLCRSRGYCIYRLYVNVDENVSIKFQESSMMAWTRVGEDPTSGRYMVAMTPLDEMLSPSFVGWTPRDGAAHIVRDSTITSSDTASVEHQKADMQSILDIFQLDEEVPDETSESEDEDDEPRPVDIEDQNRRTERLRSIHPALGRLWWASSDYMIGAAEKLADGSRDRRVCFLSFESKLLQGQTSSKDPPIVADDALDELICTYLAKWRVPMGESGILKSFLVIVGTEGVPQPLMIHVLRLIGNSSADTDENRERVVSQGSLPSIIALLKNLALLPFVIPVLYNICVDYEPAQRKASEAYLTKGLIELISSPSFIEHKAFLSYICKLLDLMVVQPNEIDLAPGNTPDVLLNLGFDPDWNADFDDFIALTSCSIAYLRHERFQKAVIKSSAVQACHRIMLFSYTRFEDMTAHMGSSIDITAPENDAQKQLTGLRSNMNQVLSDISALPEFAVTFPITSPFTSNLRRCLSSQQLQLQVMACIMLGNIARSDSACEEFVQISQIHKPLIAIIEESHSSQLLHSALGFLKNLALPMRNKSTLGEAGLLKILPRLWNMESLPQIQYSSISLARHLINGTLQNARRICSHLSKDTDSPAYQRTSLSILISIFQRTDAEPIKMEIARLLTAMCRVFTSPSLDSQDVAEWRKEFFQYHPEVGRPLSFMVSQKKWPVVRSEGWFVMALMARTPEGAIVISDIMHDVQVFQPLVKLLTGRDLADSTPFSPVESPLSEGGGQNQAPNPTPSSDDGVPSASMSDSSKEAQMARIDRENALVLISELLKYRGSEMATIRRSVFEDLLRGGGLIHLNSQQFKEREDFFDGKTSTPGFALDMSDLTEESVKEIMG